MANQLYQEMQSNQPQNQFQSFMQNPFMFLAQKQGINVPTDVQSTPQSAVQYLLNNGQMNQQAFNKLYGTLQRMGFKF